VTNKIGVIHTFTAEEPDHAALEGRNILLDEIKRANK
jgi:hypothetical protein